MRVEFTFFFCNFLANSSEMCIPMIFGMLKSPPSTPYYRLKVDEIKFHSNLYEECISMFFVPLKSKKTTKNQLMNSTPLSLPRNSLGRCEISFDIRNWGGHEYLAFEGCCPPI